MNYIEKYFKYKKKYIDLKNIKGGNFIKFEADKNKYIIDNNKNGLFEGEIFIDDVKITDVIYNGKWNCEKDNYHYFGIFNDSLKKKEYRIDCVGEFKEDGNKIIFSGIYSDKLTNKDFEKYINIPFNNYKPNNGNYENIDKLLENETIIESNGSTTLPYSKKTLFYQKGWYYLNYKEKSFYNKILHGYNAAHNITINNFIEENSNNALNFLNNQYLKYISLNKKIKSIIEKYENGMEVLNLEETLYFCSHCLQINILLINVKEFIIDGIKNFYYFSKIYSETNKYFNKKTVILYFKNNELYTLFHNDDVIIYNLITDLKYQQRIKKSKIIYKNFGINNYSASCYANASLQLLLHCPPFLKYLNEVKKINEKNIFYNLDRGLDIIFNNGNIDKNFYNDKNNIYNIIDKVMLKHGQQEDSSDFYESIFNILIKENIVYDNHKLDVKKDVKLDVKKDVKKDSKIDKIIYNIILKNIKNPINNIFTHYICNYIYCDNIEFSKKYEEQIILSIALNQNPDNKYDLNFNLNSYFENGKINDYLNNDCKEITKQIKLCYLSEIIIIQLKRFITKKIFIPYDENEHTYRIKYPIYIY